eukprot:CAMPEP_0115148562 /NCGR_PEP_ID=MMETSP0227-20121206/63948_1 /TAXON_ID=89957 /ORGANISM="Polarella glacialis, Strain CCMP 1383" /LENGTH=123 /DNA_ID=CAMNT_0002558621 /DNA_START=314 /DNA_END=686 /DNA_ORIENTATION=-
MQEMVSGVKAMVDQGLQAVVVPFLLGVDPAAITRGDLLVGVQRGDRKVAKGAHELSVVSTCAHGLADVFYQPPATLLAKLGDGHNVFTRHAIGVTHVTAFVRGVAFSTNCSLPGLTEPGAQSQ